MYFMSNFTRRKAQACATHVREKNKVLCTKLKWFILTNFNFVKSLPTRCTSHSSGNLQSSMTGWVILMTLSQDDALNKIKKHFPSKKCKWLTFKGILRVNMVDPWLIMETTSSTFGCLSGSNGAHLSQIWYLHGSVGNFLVMTGKIPSCLQRCFPLSKGCLYLSRDTWHKGLVIQTG